ncbi:MAG: hypothetical protein QOD00_1269, partial [Blastocatellia bacterium]|nr:hypothetical protein [Blastocatellia bacterium]
GRPNNTATLVEITTSTRCSIVNPTISRQWLVIN